MKAWLEDPLNYFLEDKRILGASSCKYLGKILRSNFSWADQVKYTVQKAWKPLNFRMLVLKKGNTYTKSLAYMSLVCPILEYGASCWDLNRDGQINALDHV
jgi:hypothetical protein